MTDEQEAARRAAKAARGAAYYEANSEKLGARDKAYRAAMKQLKELT